MVDGLSVFNYLYTVWFFSLVLLTLVQQALSKWGKKRLYLSLDTTVVWNCFCIVWVGVVYRGRTIPIAWRVVAQSSSSVRLWTTQRVLRQLLRG